MSTGKTFPVTLYRDGLNQPWGFRLVGGADLGAPLVIQRVSVRYFVFVYSIYKIHTLLLYNSH